MNNQAITDYLSGHEFFSELNEDILKFISEYANIRTIKKGDILFRQDETANKFYVLLNGRISVQVPALIGPTLEIQTLGKNQILGWSWLISPYQWDFLAKAEEDSELLEFDGTAILARCEQESEFGYELLKRFAALMSERLDAARLKMMKIMEECNLVGFA